MAAIDFPSSPTLNQEFTAAGRTWVWNGTAWIAKGTDKVTSTISDVAGLQTALDTKSPKITPVFTGDGTNNIAEFKNSAGLTRTWLNSNGSDFYVGGNSASSGSVQIGQGATGNQYAYIDLVGDTTYSDYGARFIRHNTGANTDTRIEHNGTGALNLQANNAGSIRMLVNGTQRFDLSSVGIVTMSGQPTISGSCTNTAATNGFANYFFALTNVGFTIGANSITVPTAGNYLVTFNTITNFTTTSRVDAGLYFNGTNQISTLSEDNGTGYHYRSVSVVRALAANDYIQFFNNLWYQNTATGYVEWRTFSITKLS